MQDHHFKIAKLMALAIMALALVACGSRNSKPDGVTVPGLTTAFVTGSLSAGTLVVVDAAFNTELTRIAAPGYRQSFSLPVSIGKSYKFYLVQNEGTADQRVYPLYQGSANMFAISSTTSLDFGYLSTSSGVAVPAHDVTGIRGVTGVGENQTLPASLAASAFSAADLPGSWQVLQLAGGGNSRWIRKSIIILADGSSPQASYVSSLDSGTAAAANYKIATGGVVTSQAGTSTLSAVMAQDRSLIVGTVSLDAGNQALVVMIKSGTPYSAADLPGSWKYQRLSAGATPSWARADASIDQAGSVSLSNAVGSAGTAGAAVGTLSGVLAIDPSGTLSDPALPAFYGVMSAGKDLVFALNTEAGAAASLTVLTRVTGGSFTGSDLLSSWRANWLSAANSTGTSNWGRASFNTDTTNSYLESILQSNGASSDTALASTITTGGVVGFSGTDFSGIVTLNKNFMVGVMTEANGNYSLYTFLK